MSGPHSIGNPADLAALYLAGALTDAEATAFEQHVDAGCGACEQELARLDEVAQALLCGCSPIVPEAHTRSALMEAVHLDMQAETKQPDGPERSRQVWRDWSDESAATDWTIRRASESPWEETGVPGIRVRRLFVDRARDQMTAMFRMEPGTAYPGHVHRGAEECLVLEGDLSVGDTVLRAGDYQRVPAGSLHGVQSTKGGCVLLIVSSLSDEMV